MKTPANETRSQTTPSGQPVSSDPPVIPAAIPVVIAAARVADVATIKISEPAAAPAEETLSEVEGTVEETLTPPESPLLSPAASPEEAATEYNVEIHLLTGKSIDATRQFADRRAGAQWAFGVAQTGFISGTENATIVYAPASIAFIRIDWKNPVRRG